MKVADRLANVRASALGPTANPRLLDKYRGEAAVFRQILHEPGEHQELWRQLEELLASEG